MDWVCQQAPGFLLPRWYNVLAWVSTIAIITTTLATKGRVLFSAHPVFMSLACVGFMSEVRSPSPRWGRSRYRPLLWRAP
jgi:hypothetical protein